MINFDACKALVRRTTSCLLLGLVVAVAGTAAAADNTPRNRAAVVFVGHSLINEDMPRMVQQMADSRGFTLHKAVQVATGSPLSANWNRCRAANDMDAEYKLYQYACDEIEKGSPIGPYDTLVATDANNSIESNRVWNKTHEYLEKFMQLMLSKNPNVRAFMFTSWEGWGYHKTGTWLDAIAGELGQYETIVRMANDISTSQGRPAIAQVLPANLALKELVIKVGNGEIPGVTSRTQIFNDDVHMTALGNYFMASVVFSGIFNQSPEGSTGRVTKEYGGNLVDLPTNTATALQRLAWQVVSNYRQGAGPSTTKPRAPTSLRAL